MESEVCFRPVKFVAVLCDAIVTTTCHQIITVSNVTFEKLEAELYTQLGCNRSELLLLTLISCIVSEHLPIFNADSVELAIHVCSSQHGQYTTDGGSGQGAERSAYFMSEIAFHKILACDKSFPLSITKVVRCIWDTNNVGTSLVDSLLYLCGGK